MKKIFNNSILILALFSLLVSCTNTDDYTGDSTQTASNPTMDVTLGFDSDITVDEGISGSQDFPFTVNLSEPQIVNVPVNISMVSGDAVEGEDIVFPHQLVIPRGTTSASGVISIIGDEKPEDTKTATLTIGSGITANVGTLNSETVNFTILNGKSNFLALTFDWAKDINYAGTDYPTCGNIDFDFLISTSPSIDDALPIYDAATGDCPEHLEMSLEDFEDGVYYLIADLWANGFAGLDTNTLVPIHTSYVWAGTPVNGVLEQDDSQILNSDTGGFEEGGSFQGYIAKITIANGTFTVDGELPALKPSLNKSVLSRPNKAERPAHLVN